MLHEIVKILFIISAVVFSVLIIFHKQFTLKIKDNVKVSNFVATIAFSLVLYIVCGILAVIFFGGLKFKLLMLFFALSPFLIGKFATYQKIKLYSYIQISVMLFSAFYIYFK